MQVPACRSLSATYLQHPRYAGAYPAHHFQNVPSTPFTVHMVIQSTQVHCIGECVSIWNNSENAPIDTRSPSCIRFPLFSFQCTRSHVLRQRKTSSTIGSQATFFLCLFLWLWLYYRIKKWTRERLQTKGKIGCKSLCQLRLWGFDWGGAVNHSYTKQFPNAHTKHPPPQIKKPAKHNRKYRSSNSWHCIILSWNSSSII